MSKLQWGIIITLAILVVCVFGLLGGILFARSSAPDIIVAFLSSPTPIPTNTPLSTSTPSPTFTPMPTSTFVPMTTTPSRTPTPLIVSRSVTVVPSCDIDNFLRDSEYSSQKLYDVGQRATLVTQLQQLIPLIEEAQAARQEYFKINVPDCAQRAWRAQLDFMDAWVAYLVLIARGATVTEIQTQLEVMSAKQKTAISELSKLKSTNGISLSQPTALCNASGFLSQSKIVLDKITASIRMFPAATATERLSLLADMKAARAELATTPVPDCAKSALVASLDALDAIIAWGYSVSSGATSSEIEAKSQVVYQKIIKVQEEIRKLDSITNSP